MKVAPPPIRERTAQPTRPPLRLPLGTTSLAITLLGLAVSVYLTVEHYTSSTALACPENTVVNCAKVTSSSYSEIGALPVPLLGVVFFVAMAALCLPRAWCERRLDGVRAAGAAAGVVAAFWFVWVELFRLDAICLWCTVVHAAALALLAAILWTASSQRIHI